jgi:hypothetical protein
VGELNSYWLIGIKTALFVIDLANLDLNIDELAVLSPSRTDMLS